MKYPVANSGFLMLILAAGCAILFSFTSCRPYDDDSAYAPVTKASFFLLVDSAAGGRSVMKRGETGFFPDWNQAIGLQNADLGDMYLSGSRAWLTDPANREVYQIDLQTETEEERHRLDIQPHFVAVGEKYLLASDSIQGAISMLNLKKKEQTVIFVSPTPYNALYNGGKFYLRKGCCTVSILNEVAMTEYAEFTMEDTIQDFLFDSFRNLYVLEGNPDSLYLSIVDANGDLISGSSRPNGVQAYQQIKISPWLNATFGTEYVGRIRWKNFLLLDTPVKDSVSHYEADFFGGRLFYQWNDSLNLYNLNTNALEIRQPFPYEILKAYHYIDVVGE